MKVAIDQNVVDKIRFDQNNEYIYLFDEEGLNDLLKTKLHCIYYENCDFVDLNLTDYDIDCIKKAKITDKDYDKVEKKDYKFGIIVPNFNYEHTIEKCLESIFNQTYKNYEIIFVDDMSTDNSIDVAQTTYLKYCAKELKGQEPEWAELPKNFKLIRLQQKRLNGGARNEAYLHLSDDVDYVYYVDSDDWLYDENVLEKINNKLQTKPDVLFVGLADYKNGKTNPNCIVPNYKNKYEALKGWSGSSGKVIKKSLATRQECLYPEGTLKEDKNQHCRICIYMESFKVLPEPVYVWNRENMKSVTTIRDKVVWGTSTIRHYADTLQLYLSEKGKDSKIDAILKNRVNMTKREMEEGNDRQW